MPLDLNTVNRSKIARDTNTDKAHISRIFSRKSRPSISLAFRIAKSLDVTVEELCQAIGITGDCLE